MNPVIYISLGENNVALSTYGVTNGYLFEIIDPISLLYTTEFYSNTSQGIQNFIDNDTFTANLLTLSGGTFEDYDIGFFNYKRFSSYLATEFYDETQTITFNLSGIQDSDYNITKIVFDKYGDGSVLISAEKDYYLTYNDTSALQIIEETNEYKSPKFKLIETKYETIGNTFVNSYTPVISAYRDNGVVNIINVTLKVAKKSFFALTANFKIIDTYRLTDKIIIKLQNPNTNQIYFTTLVSG